MRPFGNNHITRFEAKKSSFDSRNAHAMIASPSPFIQQQKCNMHTMIMAENKKVTL